jgi:hypothetical protein
MINESIIRHAAFHPNESETGIVLDTQRTGAADLFRKLFLSPFANSFETFQFAHQIGLDYNVAFKISRELRNGASLQHISAQYVKHLRACSRHPKIKPGDFFVTIVEDIFFEGSFYDGIGIYKFESRDHFLQTDVDDLPISEGFGTSKAEKASLILFTEEPFTIFLIDTKSDGTQYWQDDFLKVIPKNDEANDTSNVIKITRTFVDKLKFDPTVDGADRAHMINRSLEYLRSNENFNKDEFERSVFEDIGTTTRFREFDEECRTSMGIAITDRFRIATDIVRRQARRIKAVIKLDKNFHVYVHGDRNMIERGRDPDGRKYYKLFYNDEG